MPSMLAKREASHLIQLDRLPGMNISRQMRAGMRDEASLIATSSVFDNDLMNSRFTGNGLQQATTFPPSYDPFSSRVCGRGSSQLATQLPSSLASTHSERRSSLLAPSTADFPTFQSHEMLETSIRPSQTFSVVDSSAPARTRSYSNDFERVQYSNSSPGAFTRDYDVETASSRPGSNRASQRYNSRRRPYNQDEFDGPSHLLSPPTPQALNQRASELLSLPINLNAEEQDEILAQLNTVLSQCAYHFLAKFQFPIPIERDKSHIHRPSDREWTEWAYLLKRLATKRRIPARVLYDSQIKHLVTTLENSLDIRHSSRDQQPQQGGSSSSRPLKDDRNVLQLISAGLQVAKILMDAVAMEQLDDLYERSEALILQRRGRHRVSFF